MGRGIINKNRLKRKKRQGGQAVVEYILLLSIVIGSAAVIARQMGMFADKLAAKSGGKLEKMLRTGAESPKVWTK